MHAKLSKQQVSLVDSEELSLPSVSESPTSPAATKKFDALDHAEHHIDGMIMHCMLALSNVVTTPGMGRPAMT